MGLNNAPGVEIVMRPEALHAFLASPEGPVLRSLQRRGTVLQAAARRQVRMGHVGGGTRGNKGTRGNLRDTIIKRNMAPDGASDGIPFVRVGSESPIARLHHEGTRPHLIRPVNAKLLRFPANRGLGGGFIYATVVHHPGTKPNRYLTDNLHLAVQ